MSNETKWTPGPWSVDRNVIRGDADHLGRTVAVASTLNVAWPFGRRATKEEPYNAHLIAAAPDLYEALEKMLDLYSGIPFTIDGGSIEASEARIKRSAYAALAKARGEQS